MILRQKQHPGSIEVPCSAIFEESTGGKVVLCIPGLKFTSINNSDILMIENTHAAARQAWIPVVVSMKVDVVIKLIRTYSTLDLAMEELTELYPSNNWLCFHH